ncbi:Uu.00g033720.m01.CDS01 [Anthostomella pinea]|uniref:Uu.00g033720.m01.CDS01 n=1 Tax=Anthostomella pinea TaxID=933095 RepID=A0AAI8YAW4_9PEZI|nr:Uu.00g033720.m01.CDS01 [Anthostomella pinea]
MLPKLALSLLIAASAAHGWSFKAYKDHNCKGDVAWDESGTGTITSEDKDVSYRTEIPDMDTPKKIKFALGIDDEVFMAKGGDEEKFDHGDNGKFIDWTDWREWYVMSR